MDEPRELELTEFGHAVLDVVDAIESGDVMTYGEVAAEAGKPGAARGVGTILRNHGDGHPWWRVVAANGRLVPHGQQDHARRLKAEGVRLRNGKVDMAG